MSKGQRNRTIRKENDIPFAEIKKGITTPSYYLLKWVAVIFMFFGMYTFSLYEPLKIPDNLFYIGQALQKISFVLFGFLCSESFFHTKNKLRHFIILMSIALLSEIPYDLIKYDEMFNPDKQNAVGGLAMGFLTLVVLNLDWDKALSKIWKNYKRRRRLIPMLKIVLVTALGYLTYLLGFEYNWSTIFLVVGFAWARNKKFIVPRQIFVTLIFILSTMDTLMLSFAGFIALIPIWIAQYRNRHDKSFVKTGKLKNILQSKGSMIATRIFYIVSITAFALTRMILY